MKSIIVPSIRLQVEGIDRYLVHISIKPEVIKRLNAICLCVMGSSSHIVRLHFRSESARCVSLRMLHTAPGPRLPSRGSINME